MRNCEISNRDAILICEGLKNNYALTHLYLSNNNIDGGVFQFMEMFVSNNQKLILLDLSNNKIHN